MEVSTKNLTSPQAEHDTYRLFKACSYVNSYYLHCYHAVDLFFSGVLASLNSADYLTGVRRKENIFSLRELCVSSETGGEKHPLTCKVKLA
jgi:hypothetical protein